MPKTGSDEAAWRTHGHPVWGTVRRALTQVVKEKVMQEEEKAIGLETLPPPMPLALNRVAKAIPLQGIVVEPLQETDTKEATTAPTLPEVFEDPPIPPGCTRRFDTAIPTCPNAYITGVDVQVDRSGTVNINIQQTMDALQANSGTDCDGGIGLRKAS